MNYLIGTNTMSQEEIMIRIERNNQKCMATNTHNHCVDMMTNVANTYDFVFCEYFVAVNNGEVRCIRCPIKYACDMYCEDHVTDEEGSLKFYTVLEENYPEKDDPTDLCAVCYFRFKCVTS